VMLDADGSMDPREIGRFIQPLCDGHDLARGSRFMAGGGTFDMSPLRKYGNRSLLLLSRFLYGVSRSDLCYGYAAFRRSRIMALGLTATGFEIEAQLFLRAERAGLLVAEVPSFESPRHAGASNLHAFRDGWRVFRTIVAERLRPPDHAGDAVAVPIVADGSVSLGLANRGPFPALNLGQPSWRSRAMGLAGGQRARARISRAPDEQAMTAALVWSLAVKHRDNRLRAVALADYREARRQAAAALPGPISSRLLEMRQELTMLRS
jgi:hypothetical protein